MSDNELLLAISDMMDKKLKAELQPIKSDIQSLKDNVTKINLTLENVVIPRLNTIESCYTDTYKRYQSGVEQIDAMQSDIDIMKKVITEHSIKLQNFN